MYFFMVSQDHTDAPKLILGLAQFQPQSVDLRLPLLAPLARLDVAQDLEGFDVPVHDLFAQ
jgi:hypothetical protein